MGIFGWYGLGQGVLVSHSAASRLAGWVRWEWYHSPGAHGFGSARSGRHVETIGFPTVFAMTATVASDPELEAVGQMAGGEKFRSSGSRCSRSCLYS